MHKRAEPDGNTMGPPKLLLPDESMQPPIIVIDTAREKAAQPIFLHPVDFKIPKWLSVPTSDDREAVPVGHAVPKKLFLPGPGASLPPRRVNSRVVHPLVQKFEVGGDVSLLLLLLLVNRYR
jgi:hypothetical protein